MKILVTGSAGFIGSHLVDYLVNKGHKVSGIDDLSGGFKRNINPKSDFYKLDLRNYKKTLYIILKIKPQLIFHLAADATEGRSQFTPINCTQRNLSAYMNVLVGTIKAKTKKIVLTSSMSVYGNQKPPFDESFDLKPVDIYGINKSAMEESTKVFAQVYNLSYCIIRPHNVYGPRQSMSDPYRNVVGIFINRLLKNKHFFIYGDGEQKRSFSYIDDVVPYIAEAGLLKKTNGEIINIGPSEEYSINQLAKEILSYFVKDLNKIPKHLQPNFLPDRPQEVKLAHCTDYKAKKLLKFKHRISLKEGIKKTIDWAKNLGPQEFRYLNDVELENATFPSTWKRKRL